MIFIPAEEKHRLRATEPLFYFEFQAPNRFKTTILEGTRRRPALGAQGRPGLGADLSAAARTGEKSC